MKALLFLSVLALSGCGADVLNPSPTQAARFEEARASILASDARLPWSGEPVGPWFRARVNGIYINERFEDYTGYRQDGRIYLNPDVATYPVTRIAAILMHEARHADMRHTCGLSDQTLDEWGAWAVHIWWLDTHGYQQDAETLRRDWICQH